MIRRDEGLTFAGEIAVTAAYAAYLQSLDRAYEPDWTWLTVMGGVIISTAPAMLLARRRPGSWGDYERRVIVGFCASGLIIIGWQLWQHAQRRGQAMGFDLASRIQQEHDDADPAPSVEPAT